MRLCSKIDPYLNGALSAADAAEMHRHVTGCRACGGRLAEWQGFEARLRKWAGAVPVPDITPVDTYALMRRAVSSERQRPSRSGAWVWIAASAATACVAAALFAVFLRAPSNEADRPVTIRVANAEGAQIVTKLGPDNTVEAPVDAHKVAFIENDTLGLSASAKVKVLRASDNKTRLRLEKGTVSCKVAKRQDGGEFVVEAGALTVRVVGTKFSVARDASGDTRVTVEEGRVAVTDASGKTAMLGPGQGLAADANGRASAPIAASPDNLELTALLLDPLSDVEQHRAKRPQEPEKASPTEPSEKAADEIFAPVAPEESDTEPTPRTAPPLRKWQEWIMSGRTTEAASAMRRYLAAGDDPTVLALLADCERKEGNYKAAAKAYEKVIAKGNDKQRARALYMLGSLMQSQLGNHRRALELFETYKASAHAAPELMRLADANIIRSLVALGRCREAEEKAGQIQRGNGAVVSSNVDKMLEKCRASE